MVILNARPLSHGIRGPKGLWHHQILSRLLECLSSLTEKDLATKIHIAAALTYWRVGSCSISPFWQYLQSCAKTNKKKNWNAGKLSVESKKENKPLFISAIPGSTRNSRFWDVDYLEATGWRLTCLITWKRHPPPHAPLPHIQGICQVGNTSGITLL